MLLFYTFVVLLVMHFIVMRKNNREIKMYKKNTDMHSKYLNTVQNTHDVCLTGWSKEL